MLIRLICDAEWFEDSQAESQPVDFVAPLNSVADVSVSRLRLALLNYTMSQNDPDSIRCNFNYISSKPWLFSFIIC